MARGHLDTDLRTGVRARTQSPVRWGCILLHCRAVPAQDWPQQPIHMIVSFGPGGGADIIGRILADAPATTFS